MGIISFLEQYFSVLNVLFGIITLFLAWLIIAKGKKGLTERFVVRLSSVALVIVGIYLILYTIRGIGPEQAMTVTLIALVVGALWLAGAEGNPATMVGIALAILAGVAIGASVATLPESSPVGQLIRAITGAAQSVWNSLVVRPFNRG